MSIDHSKVAKFFTDDIKPQIEGSNFENDTLKRFAFVLEEQIHDVLIVNRMEKIVPLSATPAPANRALVAAITNALDNEDIDIGAAGVVGNHLQVKQTPVFPPVVLGVRGARITNFIAAVNILPPMIIGRDVAVQNARGAFPDIDHFLMNNNLQIAGRGSIGSLYEMRGVYAQCIYLAIVTQSAEFGVNGNPDSYDTMHGAFVAVQGGRQPARRAAVTQSINAAIAYIMQGPALGRPGSALFVSNARYNTLTNTAAGMPAVLITIIENILTRIYRNLLYNALIRAWLPGGGVIAGITVGDVRAAGIIGVQTDLVLTNFLASHYCSFMELHEIYAIGLASTQLNLVFGPAIADAPTFNDIANARDPGRTHGEFITAINLILVDARLVVANTGELITKPGEDLVVGAHNLNRPKFIRGLIRKLVTIIGMEINETVLINDLPNVAIQPGDAAYFFTNALYNQVTKRIVLDTFIPKARALYDANTNILPLSQKNNTFYIDSIPYNIFKQSIPELITTFSNTGLVANSNDLYGDIIIQGTKSNLFILPGVYMPSVPVPAPAFRLPEGPNENHLIYLSWPVHMKHLNIDDITVHMQVQVKTNGINSIFSQVVDTAGIVGTRVTTYKHCIFRKTPNPVRLAGAPMTRVAPDHNSPKITGIFDFGNVKFPMAVFVAFMTTDKHWNRLKGQFSTTPSAPNGLSYQLNGDSIQVFGVDPATNAKVPLTTVRTALEENITKGTNAKWQESCVKIFGYPDVPETVDEPHCANHFYSVLGNAAWNVMTNLQESLATTTASTALLALDDHYIWEILKALNWNRVLKGDKSMLASVKEHLDYLKKSNHSQATQYKEYLDKKADGSNGDGKILADILDQMIVKINGNASILNAQYAPATLAATAQVKGKRKKWNRLGFARNAIGSIGNQMMMNTRLNAPMPAFGFPGLFVGARGQIGGAMGDENIYTSKFNDIKKILAENQQQLSPNSEYQINNKIKRIQDLGEDLDKKFKNITELYSKMSSQDKKVRENSTLDIDQLDDLLNQYKEQTVQQTKKIASLYTAFGKIQFVLEDAPNNSGPTNSSDAVYAPM